MPKKYGEMMDLRELEKIVREVIPAKLGTFRKLRGGGDPYHFKEWEGEEILRYWFWNRERNKKISKRVFINEIAPLVKHCVSKGTIERSDFKLHCPKTHRDGSCGLAVIGRILDFFSIAKYDQHLRKHIITESTIKISLVPA